ncbi:hypothetical protein AVL61_11305 [Kocuria rosea subsp. polaris]|uniref:Uncharacterized protein n=1 Tax=Kocuria rosea subsp. polaris TaxID=136273 RepID=A0A0W8INY5_KOCRO|nr:hypothetical protein [Kocuria polaris]KUG61903.1 hypothetical protein AVL61_11305 [Kocuria polaris]
MSERFTWVSDLERGEWLRPMEAEPPESILSVVPRGFEAYARVLHPVERDRPRRTRTWQGLDETTYFEGVDDIEASLETERATWAQAAASFGTTMHAQAQYARLVRRDDGEVDGAIAADGWRYGDTSEGCLDAVSLAAASAVLARHTTTPDAGVAAVWEGWGGLLSSAGVAHFVPESSGRRPARHADEDTDENTGRGAAPSLRDRLAAAGRAGLAGAQAVLTARPGAARNGPEPGSGLLSREIATGPRFELHGNTGRRYVLFEACAADFADAAWPARAPWVDDVVWAHSPSILWPDDHAWVLATEIDFDSTLVAGTRALVRELMETPGLEVLPLRTDADLTRDGDVLDRPE